MHARTRWMALAAAGTCAAAASAWMVEPQMEAGAFDIARAARGVPATRDAIRASATAAAVPMATTPGASRAVHDVNADGRTDLLLDHAGGASFAYWQMSGGDVLGYSPVFTRPAGYTRVANADFNGDGRLDVLWVNYFPREILIWAGTPDGGFVQASAGPFANEWGVTGAADFDGDGKSDILLQAGDNVAFWVMDGARVTRYSPVSVRMPGHVLVAKGDFNGDRKADFVWEVPDTRELVMWLGDGSGFSVAPVRAYAQGWKIWGAGDIDGDGRSDLLLTHPSARLFAYWTMDGAAPVRYSPAFRLPGAESLAWRYGPVAAGDYTGDGKLDIVLSRERDQSLLLWRGDGNGFTEVPMPRHTPGWQVVRSLGAEGAPVRPYVKGDANGDGKADDFVLGMLTQYNPDGPPFYVPVEQGENWHLLRDGPTRLGFQTNPTLGGRVLATGDFDGDVRQDVVIEKAAGSLGVRRTVIRLSSRLPAYEVEIPTPAVGWRILAAGDVDGDGRSDLLLGEDSLQSLWRDNAVLTENPEMRGFAYWIMDRGIVTRYSIGFRVDPSMPRLAARGDFDGDGRLDLAWSNAAGTAEQRLVMWRGDGTGFQVRNVLAPSGAPQVPATGWHVFGAGDVDGDGKSDLLLQQSARATTNASQGIAYWRMLDNSIMEFSPGFVVSADDRVFGDYNGDGTLDFIFVRNSSSRLIQRSLTMWLGDGRGFVVFQAGGLRSPGLLGEGGEMLYNR